MREPDPLSMPQICGAPLLSWSSNVSLLDSRKIGLGLASAWVSTSVSDDDWDAFLQGTPLGHFQQSSIWAAIKAAEGWQTVRVVVRQESIIIGGFQMLIRSRRFLREGFINKGPVCAGDNLALLDWMMDLIEMVVSRERIDALLSQAPDSDQVTASRQALRSYAPNIVGGIIGATLVVPLTPDQPVEARMRKSVRAEARRGQNRGVSIRVAGNADLPKFFDMMCTTCTRQNTSPNPSSENALRHLWNAFEQKGLARLTIAECDGKATAGLLALAFGKRLTLWKKGWTEEYRSRHPNTLLTVESIKWAQGRGFELVDFVGGDRHMARTLIAGNEPDEAQRRSRYFFLLGFGAEARLLPLPRVLIPNPLARTAYKCAVGLLNTAGRIET